MALNITFLGHSGFLLDDGAHQLAIDPFLTGNELARHKPDDITCQYVALTHGHADHFGDTVEIARNNDATVIAAFEICEYLGEQGITRTEPGNPGGRVHTDFGYVAFTQAFHSSSYEGRYMGMPCGLVISMGGVKFYHCGDTCLFGDMRLIGEIAHPDIAAIPCGDRFTMGPELAARAAQMINPRVAIPIHYATFPALTDDISAFRPDGVEVRKMEPGESWSFD
jgi:L-ascorbate metabolism protein UlaG (beta-lactamase superfamily)